MTTIRFAFPGSTGQQLSGRLEKPNGRIRGWALFAHCFSCGKDSAAAVHISRALAALGIGTLRFDFTGLGESEGVFVAEGFAADVEDLVAAAGAMMAQGMEPTLLIGHSLGGAAVLAAAQSLPSARAVATIAAPFEVAHALNQIDAEGLAAIERDGSGAVRLGGRPFTLTRRFVNDLRAQPQGDRIGTLGRPLLVLHGPGDDEVGIDNATWIFLAARHPKSFVSLNKADHFLTDRSDTTYAAGVIAAWAEPYLPVLADPPLSADVVAEETGEGQFQVEVSAAGVRILVDEPVSVGGLGSGPTPSNLLAAALASCTTMTLRMYARRKGWPVGLIRTAVGHVRTPGDQPPDVFTRRISFEGELDAEHRPRLMEIADRCPVHRMLEQRATIRTEFGDPPAPSEPLEAHEAAMIDALDGADTSG